MDYTWSQFIAFLNAAEYFKRTETATALVMTATAQDGKATKETLKKLTSGNS